MVKYDTSNQTSTGYTKWIVVAIPDGVIVRTPKADTVRQYPWAQKNSF